MVAAVASGLGLLVLLALFGLPLALRGPVLRALARHQSKSLCGTVEIAGGHLGPNVVIALIRQRPFDVALDGVRIREPEGDDLFRARTIRLRLAVRRKPWRVVVESARIAHGAWRLVDRGEGQGLTAALASLPAAGRGACRAPSTEPQKPPPLGPIARIDAVTLQDVSLILSFPAWAVTLDALDAHGALEARGTPDGVKLLFEASDVRTRQHGLLRIGPAGPRAFEIPFDSVDIPRVAVTDAAPYDLRLSVAAARTREARLTGEATFTDVFAPESAGRAAGMILQARWSELGQALARNPSWADVGRRLALLHTGVRTSLRGPFEALTGSADVDGKGLSLRARLLAHHRYTLDANFRALDTRPLLARDQRSSLGGRLDGHFAVTARLGAAPKDPVAHARRDHARPSTRTGGRRDPAALGDRAHPSRLVTGAVVGQRRRPRGAGHGRAPGRRDRRQPGSRASRRRGDRRQPSRQRRKGQPLRARFAPDSRATFRGETFRLPPRLDIDSNARHDVTIAPFTIANVAGGTVGVAGSIRHDGPLELRATVARYPLVHLPGVARAHVPGQSAPLGRLLGGELDADFTASRHRPLTVAGGASGVQ